MKKSLALLLCSVFILSLAGQNNYKPGYIITNDKDTLYGLIDYRTDFQNSQECHFKNDNSVSKQVFFPGRIEGYRFTENGKYYTSGQINLNGKDITIFLEYLVQGLMSVYYYENREGQKYFFFEDEAGDMKVVTQEPDKIIDNKVYKDKRYNGQLRYIFNEYLPTEDYYNKVDFNQKSIIDIAKSYHDQVCTTGEECIIFENKNPDEKLIDFRFSFYGGISWSTYYFNTTRSGNTYSNSHINPLIGAQVELIYTRKLPSFSVLVDLSFAQFRAPMKDMGNKLQSEYEGLLLSPKIGIKYTYRKFKLQPSIEAGLLFSYLFNLTSTIKDESFGDDYYRDYTLKKRFYGAYIGIGLDYKIKNNQAIFIHATYDTYMKGDLTQKNSADYIRTPQLRLGYAF